MRYILILAILLSNTIMAKECDWKTIQEKDGLFIYQPECHSKVGQLVKEEKLREEQVAVLNKSLELKDLALDAADKRATLWRNTTFDLENRLIKQEKYSEWNRWVWLGTGIGVAVLSGWAMSHAAK